MSSGIMSSGTIPTAQGAREFQKTCDSRFQKIIQYTKENLPTIACKTAYVAGVVIFAIGVMNASAALITIGSVCAGLAIISTIIHRYINERAIDKHAREFFDATEALREINEYEAEKEVCEQAQNRYTNARKQVERDLELTAPKDLIKYIDRLSKACNNPDFKIDSLKGKYQIAYNDRTRFLGYRDFVSKIVYSKIDQLEEDYDRDMQDFVRDIENSFFEDTRRNAEATIDTNELKKAFKEAVVSLANNPKYKILYKNSEEIFDDLYYEFRNYYAVISYGIRNLNFLQDLRAK